MKWKKSSIFHTNSILARFDIAEVRFVFHLNIVANMGGGTFFKVGGTNGNPKKYTKFLWFELATVTSQAFKHDAINFCQHV